MNVNTIKRALKIKHIVDIYFVPETQNNSQINIYRRYIANNEGISISTFWRYMKIGKKIEGFVGTGNNKRKL